MWQELGVEWYRNKVASYQDKNGSGVFLDITGTVEGGCYRECCCRICRNAHCGGTALLLEASETQEI